MFRINVFAFIYFGFGKEIFITKIIRKENHKLN